MEINLFLGGICFRFLSSRPRIVEPELTNFLAPEGTLPDLTIELRWDWENARKPQTTPLGENALITYYSEPDMKFFLAKGGHNGPLACTSYSPDFSRVVCTFNDGPFLFPLQKLGSTLRLLPMLEIFQHFGVLFLHASQINFRGRGILFAAPSGTGKTTQAKLWQNLRGAEVLCNDRTLLRRSGEGWLTYGYPLDGKEPVRSSQVTPLGCLVVLRQGELCQVQRLRPSRAAPLLMEQAVIDTWNSQARTAAMDLILSLLTEIPVFQLTCTPDEQAVETLERILLEEKVIPNG